jgi:CDP-diacylglycerol--glycerol-3-phosphate 3-phosphatidyltransferase
MISNTVTALRLLLLVPLYVLASSCEVELRWAAVGVYLLAGLTDILDGFLARKLGEVSAAGAMLDLLADRLMMLVVVAALAAAGTLHGLGLLAGVALIGRSVVVATLNEALPGRLDIRVSPLERVKITFQVVGFTLLIAPPFAFLGRETWDFGVASLVISAALSIWTVIDYAGRAWRAFRGT